MDIEELELSTRLLKSLRASNVNTVDKALRQSRLDLATLPNIGPKGCHELMEALEPYRIRSPIYLYDTK